MTPLYDSAIRSLKHKGEVTLATQIEAYVMPAAASALMLAAVWAVAIAHRWPLVHDAALIHYVVFLMDYGKAPYRDIIEMNMPGTYILDWIVVHALGGGAFGLWLFDLFSGTCAIAASAWIAGTGRRSAAIAGGAFAYLIHLSHGPANFGQRDWVVAVILLIAFGCMFHAIRRDRPSWMAGFMALCGFAASIKPPILAIGIVFLAATCWLVYRLRRASGTLLCEEVSNLPENKAESKPDVFDDEGPAQTHRWQSFAWWSLVGALAPSATVALFLLRWGVVRSLLDLMRGLLPWYASLQRADFNMMVLSFRTIDSPLKEIFLGAGLVFLLNRSWRRWESCFLLAGLLAGTAIFVWQGKGFTYHLYTQIVFAALWGMLEFDLAVKSSRWPKIVASIALAITCFITVPTILWVEWNATYLMDTITHLETDLDRLGGSGLSGKVQCLDMTRGGCINVLYRMKLVQATGFIYDYYLFPRQTNATTTSLQTRFLREVTARPPQVIVLSSHTWPGDTYDYEQVKNWPSFADFLQRSYRLDRELPNQAQTAGYRIYVLKQLPLQ